jgi:hypothetical protein
MFLEKEFTDEKEKCEMIHCHVATANSCAAKV